MSKKSYMITALSSMGFGLIGSVIGVYFTGFPVLAQSKETIKEVIKAQSFQLVDKNGKIRGAMDATADVTMFYLKDKNGNLGVDIQESEDGSRITLTNSKKQRIVSLRLDSKTSEASLNFYSDNQKRLDNGSIKLLPRLSLNSYAGTSGNQIMLSDNNAKPSIILEGNKNGESGSLSLLKNDKLFWNAPN